MKPRQALARQENTRLEHARCEPRCEHARRGQTLVETALFLPLLLLALFGIIYFSQYGVLQERSLTGARFASLISNGGATTGLGELRDSSASKAATTGAAVGADVGRPCGRLGAPV